jgi:hypothetical protein
MCGSRISTKPLIAKMLSTEQLIAASLAAANNGHVDQVKALLKSALPTLETRKAMADYAAGKGHREVVELLVAGGYLEEKKLVITSSIYQV